MRLIILSILIVFTAQSAAATCAGQDLRPGLSVAEQAIFSELKGPAQFATGNHWVATKGQTTIRLIGTLHVDDPRFDAVMDRLAPQIASAQMLLVEMDSDEKAKLESALVSRPDMLLLTGNTLPELMPDEIWLQLAAAAKARGLPGFMAAKMQPWYLSMLLAIPPCAMAELAKGANGLDHRIMELADRFGIPSQSLEPYDTLFSIFADEPLDEQIAMLQTSLQPAEQSENSFITLSNLYFEENHYGVWNLGRILAERAMTVPKHELDALFAEMRADVLTNRNAAWVPKILAASQGKSIVVAVGAAHLSGPDGLLTLMSQQGFELERQPF